MRQTLLVHERRQWPDEWMSRILEQSPVSLVEDPRLLPRQDKVVRAGARSLCRIGPSSGYPVVASSDVNRLGETQSSYWMAGCSCEGEEVAACLCLEPSNGRIVITRRRVRRCEIDASDWTMSL